MKRLSLLAALVALGLGVTVTRAVAQNDEHYDHHTTTHHTTTHHAAQVAEHREHTAAHHARTMSYTPHASTRARRAHAAALARARARRHHRRHHHSH